MKVEELKAFLESPRVDYLGLQDPEINSLFKELHQAILDTTRPAIGVYKMYTEKAPDEKLPYSAILQVDNFVSKVWFILGIDLKPECRMAFENSSILRFSTPPKLRLIG